jgi:hypothetical protein
MKQKSTWLFDEITSRMARISEKELFLKLIFLNGLNQQDYKFLKYKYTNVDF